MEASEGSGSSDRAHEMGRSRGNETAQQVGQILKGDHAVGLSYEAPDAGLNRVLGDREAAFSFNGA